MKNVMEIKGYKALIAFDPETNRFRGETSTSMEGLTSTQPM